MSLSDLIPICGLKYGLQPFQVFRVYYMLVVKVTTISGEILADNMGLKKVKYLLFHI